MTKTYSTGTYGTIQQYHMRSEEDGELLSQHINSKSKQRKRWTETLLYLIPLFLAVFFMEWCKLVWAKGDVGSSIAGSFWVGFGAAVGAILGRLLRVIFVMRSPLFRLSHEVDEAFVMSLSIMLGPASSLYSVEYFAAKKHYSTVVSFILVFLVCMLGYFGAPLICRSILSFSHDEERKKCNQTKEELWRDLYLSISVGCGFAFLVFNNDDLVSPSLLTLLGINETDNSYAAMMIYGIVFSVGYCTSQTIQNSFLSDTWTDGDN